MIQRGITRETVVNFFKRFVEFSRDNGEIIIVGAYSILGKPDSKSKLITLRIDVDEVSEEKGAAHVVTVFVGSGNVEDTLFITLEQKLLR